MGVSSLCAGDRECRGRLAGSVVCVLFRGPLSVMRAIPARSAEMARRSSLGVLTR